MGLKPLVSSYTKKVEETGSGAVISTYFTVRWSKSTRNRCFPKWRPMRRNGAAFGKTFGPFEDPAQAQEGY